MDSLSPVEVRVLGSLIEKDITTPDYYPLTLNALTNACNQSSNRDPVMALGEQAIVEALNGLREKKLAFMVQGGESRVAKFGHRIAETFELARPETAVLCVLLLRGPQTPGEIRGRTGRMHEFANLEETEASLAMLIERTPEALAVKLPRQAGTKEQRFAHLLGGAVSATAPVGTTHAEVPFVDSKEERIARLEAEVSATREEVADLKAQLAELKAQLT
jgi:uncharacterized protein YceH (UPF0502 family)